MDKRSKYYRDFKEQYKNSYDSYISSGKTDMGLLNFLDGAEKSLRATGHSYLIKKLRK